MQILFRFNGSEELEVNTSPGSVQLWRRESPYFTTGVGPIGSNQPPMPQPPPSVEHIPFLLNMTKSEARSIASALMQAAAEL